MNNIINPHISYSTTVTADLNTEYVCEQWQSGIGEQIRALLNLDNEHKIRLYIN